MKKKIYMLLAVVMAAMTASADDTPTYALTIGETDHGAIKFIVDETENATTAAEGQTVTVVITPDAGWVVNTPSGIWYAANASAPKRVAPAELDLLNTFELEFDSEDETTKAQTYTFTMERANVEVSATYKKLVKNAWISEIQPIDYTGMAMEPEIVVKDGNTTLVEGTDYTISYTNNRNAGQSTAAKAPTVTITGIGENYSGTASRTFTINPGTMIISADHMTITYGDPVPQYTVNYSPFAGDDLPSDLGGKLVFDCKYQQYSDVGRYVITPSGLTSTNYVITFLYDVLTVEHKALENGFIVAIDDVTYNGEEQTPEPVVKYGTKVLTKGVDYTVAYADNTDAGTATVTITGLLSSNYSGTASATFNINKADITVKAPTTIKGLVYNGSPQALVQAGSTDNGEMQYSVNGGEWSADVPTGTEAGEYTVQYRVVTDGNYNGLDAQTLSVVTIFASEEEVVVDKSDLTKALQAANKYYESIKDDYPEVAATLLEAINSAADVEGDEDAIQAVVDEMQKMVEEAIQSAEDAVSIATGIRSLDRGKLTDDGWYDLNGRRVAHPTKGLYIHGGKKILVK